MSLLLGDHTRYKAWDLSRAEVGEKIWNNPTKNKVLLQQLADIRKSFNLYLDAIYNSEGATWAYVDYQTLLSKLDLISMEPEIDPNDMKDIESMISQTESLKWKAEKIQEASRQRSDKIIAMNDWSDEDKAAHEQMRERIEGREAA